MGVYQRKGQGHQFQEHRIGKKRGGLASNSRKLSCLLVLSFLIVGLLSGCSSSRNDSSKSSFEASSSGAAKPESAAAAVDKKSDSSSSLTVVGQTDNMAKTKDIAVITSEPTKNGPITVMPATGSDEAAGFNRKLIYRANLVMPVEDYSKAQTALRDLVALSGAYILQFSENANTGERGGTYTIKVAANGFVSLLDGLEKMSPSIQRNVQGQDVTEEYVDLNSRLKAKQMVETRLLSFMEKASKTDDLLAYSNELAKVQETIEQIKGRMRYLDQNVSFSTIELRMYQQTGNKPLLSDPNKQTLEERIQKAWNSSLNVLVAVLQGILVFLAAALPVFVIAAIIGVPIWMFKRRRNKQLVEMRNQLKTQNAALSAHTEEKNEETDKE
ncbi:DUF4349 domain-containing protein [Paenibacillus sp. N3.4]|nr:DUF4349 domain-containing protein [Paenibacillus sp. N3.4]